uniref:Uncharacterized protein n=1 Tax=Cacopsylla melanoneura TaxID=428564 RepID=A0A8D8ZBC6_9HEMI
MFHLRYLAQSKSLSLSLAPLLLHLQAPLRLHPRELRRSWLKPEVTPRPGRPGSLLLETVTYGDCSLKSSSKYHHGMSNVSTREVRSWAKCWICWKVGEFLRTTTSS